MTNCNFIYYRRDPGSLLEAALGSRPKTVSILGFRIYCSPGCYGSQIFHLKKWKNELVISTIYQAALVLP